MKALGIWSATVPLASALGVTLGGVLSQGPGWRAVFLVNVPVGAVALALVRSVLSESRDPHAPRRLDVAGAVALTLGLTALVHGLTARAIAPLVLAAASLAAFAALERRVRAPLVPPGSLSSTRLLSAGAVAAVVTATTTPPLFLCLLYVAHELHRGPLATGLTFAPVNLAVIAGSWLGPRLLARTSPAATMAAGLAAIATGALGLLGISGQASLLAPFVTMGLGIGLAATASTAAGTAASEDRRGLASGLLNAAAQIGTSLGLALLVGVAAGDYRRGFAGAALLAGAGSAAMWVLTRRDSPRGCPAG